MHRIRAAGMTLVAVALAATACSSEAAAVTLGPEDTGTTVTVAVDDRIDVALPGNPTTGYTWTIAAIDDAVLVSRGEPAFRADSTLVGSGGTMTLTFDAVGAGTTTVELAYRRPFETAPAEDTFTVTVVVTG
jgi:predicted secreted protein